MEAAATPQDLYPRLLGETWNELAAAVRAAHGTCIEKRGRFRVVHGGHPIVRGIIRFSKLPGKSDDTEVTLTIHRGQELERWERHFGSTAFTTTQRAAAGCLAERFGNWELRFALKVAGGALEYEQCGARLCAGPLRLPVPLAWAPRVRAREQAKGPDEVHVQVTVSLPLLGPLITYDGHLIVKDSAS